MPPFVALKKGEWRKPFFRLFLFAPFLRNGSIRSGALARRNFIRHSLRTRLGRVSGLRCPTIDCVKAAEELACAIVDRLHKSEPSLDVDQLALPI